MASTSDTIINPDIPLSQLNSSSAKEIEQEVDHPVVESKENKSDTIITLSHLIPCLDNEIEQEVGHPVVERKENTGDTIINPDILLSQQDSSSANQIEKKVDHPVVERKKENNNIREASQIKISNGRLPESRKPASSDHCIYRVPENLRKGNEIHFTPRVVSIGPYHLGKSKYANMEAVKKDALDRLIKDSKQTKEFFLTSMLDHEPYVRGCYPEADMGLIESDKFVQMMLFDAAFIIKFFDTFRERGVDYGYGSETYSLFLNRQNVAAIEHDLRLLENQLPLSFLEKVRDLFIDNGTVMAQDNDLTDRSFFTGIWHLPPGVDRKGKKQNYLYFWFSLMRPSRNKQLHFLDQLRFLCLPTHFVNGYERDAPKVSRKFIKNAKKLQEAGVKLRAENRVRAACANFTSNGKLNILPLCIDDTSETSYLNFIAFEQRHFKNHRYVSDYIILMDMLIRKGSEQILENSGLIVNELSGDKTATNFLRDLCKNVSNETHPFHLGPLCKAVEMYCDRPAGKFIRAFNTTTWQVGATFVLFLTLLQTIFAAIALFQSWKQPHR